MRRLRVLRAWGMQKVEKEDDRGFAGQQPSCREAKEKKTKEEKERRKEKEKVKKESIQTNYRNKVYRNVFSDLNIFISKLDFLKD